MRKIVCKLYKGCWLFCFLLGCKCRTAIFKLKLILNNVSFDKGLRVQGTAIPQLRISYKAKQVKFGNGVIFNNYNDAGWNSKCSIWVKGGAKLIVGDYSGFNGALLYAATSVTIGKNVKVGGGSRIFDTDFHPLDYEARRTNNIGTKTAPVAIDDDVFIGTNCIVGKGVHIGARSIVAAGSVVVKDIPANEIWGGTPAKFIRKI